MLNKLRKITDILRPVYLALLTCFTLLREVVPLAWLMSNDLFAYSFFAVGLLLAALTFYTDRRSFAAPSVSLLVGFIVVCVVSLALNRLAILNNIKTIGWLVIFFLLIYVSGANASHNKNRDITAIFSTAVAVMGILTFVSLLMYFYNIDYTYDSLYFHKVFNQGFSNQYKRLWGVFLENNYASTYGVAVLFMAAYLFKKHRNVFARILLVIASLNIFSYIVLTNSRTVQVVFIIVGIWVAIYLTATKTKAKKFLKATAITISAVAGAIIAFALLFTFKTVLPYVKIGVLEISGKELSKSIHRVYDDFYTFGDVIIFNGLLPEEIESEPDLPDDETDPDEMDPEKEEPDFSKPESLDRTDLGKSDFSNGRFIRWQEGFEIFCRNPLFGASPRGTRDFAIENMPDSMIATRGYAISNFIIDIMASTGIVGISIVLIILIKTLLIVIFAAFKQPFNKKILFVGGILLTLVVASMFQTDLFFNMAFGGVAFWSSMGVVNTHTMKRQNANEDERVLVYGLKDPAGGVEHVALEYARAISKSHSLKFDFIYFGSCSVESEITEFGGRVIYLPSRKRKPFAYKRALRKLFEKNNYVAVWGNYSGLTNIDLLTYAYRYDIPVRVAHSHVTRLYWDGLLMKCFVNVFHRLNKFLIDDYTTHYFACSELAGKFMFPKIAHGRLVICKNSVDIDRFFPGDSVKRAELNIADSTFVVAHVARLCEVKNQPFLLKVFNSLTKKRPDSVLLMIGDGEKKEDLVSEAANLDISDKVIFLGERKDVAELLRASDVFVLPSLSEGLGLVAIEAQACAVPCVVSDAVPEDVNITGTVRFMPLNASANEWADAVISTSEQTIANASECVEQGGYDIRTESEKVYKVFKGEN